MENRERARTDRFRVGTWGIRVARGYPGVSTGAWLGFGNDTRAQIILDDEVGEQKDFLVRFETEEDARTFLVERTLAGERWADVIEDLAPKLLDKNLW